MFEFREVENNTAAVTVITIPYHHFDKINSNTNCSISHITNSDDNNNSTIFIGKSYSSTSTSTTTKSSKESLHQSIKHKSSFYNTLINQQQDVFLLFHNRPQINLNNNNSLPSHSKQNTVSEKRRRRRRRALSASASAAAAVRRKKNKNKTPAMLDIFRQWKYWKENRCRHKSSSTSSSPSHRNIDFQHHHLRHQNSLRPPSLDYRPPSLDYRHRLDRPSCPLPNPSCSLPSSGYRRRRSKSSSTAAAADATFSKQQEKSSAILPTNNISSSSTSISSPSPNQVILPSSSSSSAVTANDDDLLNIFSSQQYSNSIAANNEDILIGEELKAIKKFTSRMLVKLNETPDDLPTSSDDECVVCVTNRACLQTFPCGHQVACRKCFLRTVQIAIAERQFPLRCVVCRSKIARLKHQSGIRGVTIQKQRTPPLPTHNQHHADHHLLSSYNNINNNNSSAWKQQTISITSSPLLQLQHLMIRQQQQQQQEPMGPSPTFLISPSNTSSTAQLVSSLSTSSICPSASLSTTASTSNFYRNNSL